MCLFENVLQPTKGGIASLLHQGYRFFTNSYAYEVNLTQNFRLVLIY